MHMVRSARVVARNASGSRLTSPIRQTFRLKVRSIDRAALSIGVEVLFLRNRRQADS